MCCILYIAAGVDTPTIATLESVYLFNRHGIGFADADGNSCKTLSFRRFTKEIQKRHRDAACIIHFRLATHGSISEKNCHPFYDEAHNVWFAHNGVLPIRSHDDMTDSEIFFREGFIPALNDCGDYSAPELWQYVENERCGTRFIFMHGNDIKMLGNWHELDGVFYSNMNWAGYRYHYGSARLYDFEG
jgi:hypothetical protein